jgi:hypothetical protein
MARSQVEVQAEPGPPQSRSAQSELPIQQQLSLREMSRIMDVATALRKERALVEQQFNLPQLKQQLRDRLLESARVTGDPVTAEEIDAAVDQYYDRLHEFTEPRWSWRTPLAHLWVRRGPIVQVVVGLAAIAAVLWGLLMAGVLPGERRTGMLVSQRIEQATQLAATIDQLAANPRDQTEARQWFQSAQALAQRQDVRGLDEVLAQMASLQTLLQAQYTVSVVASPGQASGIQREYTDDSGTRTSGYYVFVEARDARGQLVKVPITNRETGQTEMVSRWGEQVPLEVFERLAQDKKSDGALDERLFGEKRVGQRQLEIEMPGAQGEPLERRGQITRWE